MRAHRITRLNLGNEDTYKFENQTLSPKEMIRRKARDERDRARKKEVDKEEIRRKRLLAELEVEEAKVRARDERKAQLQREVEEEKENLQKIRKKFGKGGYVYDAKGEALQAGKARLRNPEVNCEVYLVHEVLDEPEPQPERRRRCGRRRSKQPQKQQISKDNFIPDSSALMPLPSVCALGVRVKQTRMQSTRAPLRQRGATIANQQTQKQQVKAKYKDQVHINRATLHAAMLPTIKTLPHIETRANGYDLPELNQTCSTQSIGGRNSDGLRQF
jgi:hypothetical protein